MGLSKPTTVVSVVSSQYLTVGLADVTAVVSVVSSQYLTVGLADVTAVVSVVSNQYLTAGLAMAYMPAMTAVPYLFWKIIKISRAFRKYGYPPKSSGFSFMENMTMNKHGLPDFSRE